MQSTPFVAILRIATIGRTAGDGALTEKHVLGQFLSRIAPGLREEKTVSGVVIDVSASGTTSVSSGSMSELALRRFAEMRKAPDDSSEQTA